MIGVRWVFLLVIWGLGAALPRDPAARPARVWRPDGAISRAAVGGGGPTYRAGLDRTLSRHPLDDRLQANAAERRLEDRPPVGQVLDVRYVDQVYAQGKLECSAGRVCVWNDCGPASAAMVLHFEGLEPRDALTNRQATLDLVCEAKANCKGTTNRERMLSTLQNHGLNACAADFPSLASIQNSIDHGHPVILSLTPWPDHVLVAIGYQPDGVVVVHDPYGGAFWWRHWDPINEPRSNQPKRSGEGVAYEYADLEPLVMYGLFTTGPIAGAAFAAPSTPQLQ